MHLIWQSNFAKSTGLPSFHVTTDNFQAVDFQLAAA